jgi:hypothetical protein
MPQQGRSQESHRPQTALERSTKAAGRDQRAHDRDVAARARDVAATARDLAMTRIDGRYERDASRRAVTGAEVVIRAAEQRARAERYRLQAAEHRALARADRVAAVKDREEAARDRLQAVADRELITRELLAARAAAAAADTSPAGLRDLDRELDRCRRCGSTLVVACVTAVGSNGTRDASSGPFPRHVRSLLEQRLRSYDLVIPRGDELVCALPGAELGDARRRLRDLAAELASHAHTATVTAGLAEARAQDSSAELVARAERTSSRILGADKRRLSPVKRPGLDSNQ